MSIFTPNFEKPGPGIPKNAPPKKGISLFFDILIREFWQLIKLNLIFVISCLPVVTIGCAIAGLSKSTTKMVRDVPNDVWEDFKTGFRENWKTSTALGCMGILLFAGGYLGCILYKEYPILQTISIVFLILLANIWIHVFPMLTNTTLTTKEVVRNSFLLTAVRFYYSIPTAIICLIYIGAQLMLFPFSIPFALFLGFSIPCFIGSFTAWSSIKRYIIRQENNVNDQ